MRLNLNDYCGTGVCNNAQSLTDFNGKWFKVLVKCTSQSNSNQGTACNALDQNDSALFYKKVEEALGRNVQLAPSL